MKKKMAIRFLCFMLLVSVLGACGQETQYDENGNAQITSKWEWSEITVNGETSRREDDPWIVNAATESKAPAFKSSDGTTCVFSNNAKDHKGTITMEGDKFRIDFDDTTKDLIGEIRGDELVIVNESGSLKLVFTAK